MIVRALAFAAVLLLLPATTRAVTIDDLIGLSKAGVSADILVALIDADRTIFTLSSDDIIRLAAAGVPDAVVVKMLGTAREFADEAPPPLIVGRERPRAERTPHDARRPAAHAFTAYPVFVPVPVTRVPLTFEIQRGFGRFMNDGWVEGRGFGRFMTSPAPTSPDPARR